MKDQLISFETAKLAKEKGFDEFCVHYYSDSGIINGFKIYQDYYVNKVAFYKNTYRPIIIDKFNCVAPTQSLLQKWLREIHGIVIEIQTGYYPCIHTTYKYDNKDGFLGFDEVEEFKYPNQYVTYEEALEVGLKTALKLI